MPVPDEGYEYDPTENDGHSLPKTGEPNSYQDRYDKEGNLVERRYYDSDGRMIKDTHYTDHGNPKQHPDVPHDHYWNWSNGYPAPINRIR